MLVFICALSFEHKAIYGGQHRHIFCLCILHYRGAFALHWWLPEENMKASHIPPITPRVWEMICIRFSFSGNVHVCQLQEG